MITFDEAPVRAAIVAKIGAVANVGDVHDYERYAATPAALKAEYVNSAQGGQRICGWFVSKLRAREVYTDIGRWVLDIDWRIGGYMSLDDADATEKKIAVLVESIRDAFRNDDSLGGVVATCAIDSRGMQVGAQLEALDHVMFCGALCHRALLGLTTRSYLG